MTISVRKWHLCVSSNYVLIPNSNTLFYGSKQLHLITGPTIGISLIRNPYLSQLTIYELTNASKQEQGCFTGGQ